MPEQAYNGTTTRPFKRKADTKPAESFNSTVAKRSRPDRANTTVQGSISPTAPSYDLRTTSETVSLPPIIHSDGNDPQPALEMNAKSPAIHDNKPEHTSTTSVGAAKQALPPLHQIKPSSSRDSSRTPPTTHIKSAYESAQPSLVTEAKSPIVNGDEQHPTSATSVTANSLALNPLQPFKLMSFTDYLPNLLDLRFHPIQDATRSTMLRIAKTLIAKRAKWPGLPATSVSATNLALNDLHHLIGLSKEIIHDYWSNGLQWNNNAILTLEDLTTTFEECEWYSTVTFLSLRAALDIPIGWLVVVTFDENPAIQPITGQTTNIAYINYEPRRDHWTLVHLSIKEWRVIYYDGIVGDDGTDHLRTKLNCAKAINDVRFKRPRPDVDLPDEDPPMLAMVRWPFLPIEICSWIL